VVRETFGQRGTPFRVRAVWYRFQTQGATGHRRPRHLDVAGRNGTIVMRSCRCKPPGVEGGMGCVGSVPGNDGTHRGGDTAEVLISHRRMTLLPSRFKAAAQAIVQA
jgi:hypothetical protein